MTATPDRNPNGNGWYNAPVTFTFSGNDGSGSGIASCDTAKTYSGPETATASITGHCTDVAGNTGSTTANFKYDVTNPTITITAPTAKTYLLKQAVTVNFSCGAALSGVDSCVGTMANGGKLDTSSPGSKSVSSSSLTLTAINVDGKVTPVPSPGNANPGNLFVYSSGYYQYNLKVPTSGLNPGKQHYLSFTVSGDTVKTYTAIFYTK